MARRIVRQNGREIDIDQVPRGGVSGSELIRQAGGLRSQRRKILKDPAGFREINSGSNYGPHDLGDRHGNPLTISDIPERSKGGNW